MNIPLWNAPYNGGWIWFSRANIRRFSAGWQNKTLWWALLGFSGRFTLQDNPLKPWHWRGR